MSENEHAQEIRKRTRAIIDAGWYLEQRPRWESVVTVVQEITDYTDALAAQLVEADLDLQRCREEWSEMRKARAEAEARVERERRCRKAFEIRLYSSEGYTVDMIRSIGRAFGITDVLPPVVLPTGEVIGPETDGDLPDAARREAGDAR